MSPPAARTHDERVAVVRRVVSAARGLVAKPGALVEELERTTGLSRAGIELALARHLELDPSDDELDALVRGAEPAAYVHVVLSANVFVGALRALALAWAAAPRVTVRPSRREPAFARALVGALAAAEVTLAEELDPAEVAEGELHVYGRDETIARVRARARPGVRTRGHGAGMGVAWVGEGARIDEAAALLADDVVPFDQRGCLSPRAVLVEGGAPRGRELLHALHAALGARGEEVPRGALTPEEDAERTRWRVTMAYGGELLEGPHHGVAMSAAGAALVVPPTGRHVHIACVEDAASAAALLAPIAPFVVAVGGLPELPFALPHARVSPLGRMQRPPLDGPVDRRDASPH